MIHCSSLREALGAASAACRVWKTETAGETKLLRELLELEAQAPEGSFYVVSREGAIGLAEGAEYRTRWLYIPTEAAEEHAALARERERLEAEGNQIEPAAAIPAEPPVLVAAEPAKQPEEVPAAPVPELTLEPQLDAPVFEPAPEPELVFEAAKPPEAPVPELTLETPILDLPTYRTAKRMTDAAGFAAQKCSQWRFKNEAQHVYVKDAFLFACARQDEAYPLDAGNAESYYLVSPEGAIGLTEDDGKRIDWLFLPVGVVAVSLPESLSREPKVEIPLQPPVAPEPPAPFGKPKQQTCPKCGKPVTAGSKFCMSCGARLGETQSTKRLCKNCGAELGAGNKFCMKCGTKVS